MYSKAKVSLSPGGEISTSAVLSSSYGDIKDAEEYVKYKQRRALLYAIVTFLVFAVLAALTITFIVMFAVKTHPTTDQGANENSTIKNKNIVEYQSPQGRKKTYYMSDTKRCRMIHFMANRNTYGGRLRQK